MQLQSVLQHVRRTVLVHDNGCLTDDQLLEAFITRKVEAAFAAIVRRHGPMVLGVCRRVLRNADDAEDAFQATFLVLVRKAASVVPRDNVGAWLHGVARTTAIRATSLAARRRRWERQVVELPEAEARPDKDALWRDLQPVLDQELDRLPFKYRIPIVLCDLENRTIREAAQSLDGPQGTVAGRLARGRKMLAGRLARRGVTISAGALATLAAQNASAHVSATLLMPTFRLCCFAVNQAASDVSVNTLTLVEGVIRTMMWKKLNMVVLAIGVLATGIGAGAIGMRDATAARHSALIPPVTRANASTKADAEPKEYRVEVRLMEALPRPTTFHADREVFWFPAMVMADDQHLPVNITDVRMGAPDEARSNVSLTASIHHKPSGKVAIDLTYHEQRNVKNPPPMRSEHVNADVVSGKVAKLRLPKRGDHPGQWFEVMVHANPFTGPCVPPRKANVYQIELNMHERRGNQEKEYLSTPTFAVTEGRQAEFVSGADTSVAGETVLTSGLHWTATIKKMSDGRVRLDMRVDKNRKKHEDKDEVQVHTSSLHIIKVTTLDKKLNFTLDPIDSKSPPINVQVVVSEITQS